MRERHPNILRRAIIIGAAVLMVAFTAWGIALIAASGKDTAESAYVTAQQLQAALTHACETSPLTETQIEDEVEAIRTLRKEIKQRSEPGVHKFLNISVVKWQRLRRESNERDRAAIANNLADIKALRNIDCEERY